MDSNAWGLLVLTCFLGAVSPGPSLICILQIAMTQGRWPAVVSAVSHGIGVALWAIATIYGLSSLFLAAPNTLLIVTGIGGTYLVYIGIKALNLPINKSAVSSESTKFGTSSPGFSGFSIAFLNPKLAIFFTALFSQFLSNNLTVIERWSMVFIAGGIDMLWYILVALIASHRVTHKALISKLRWIDVFAGIVFITVGCNVLFHTLQGI